MEKLRAKLVYVLIVIENNFKKHREYHFGILVFYENGSCYLNLGSILLTILRTIFCSK